MALGSIFYSLILLQMALKKNKNAQVTLFVIIAILKQIVIYVSQNPRVRIWRNTIIPVKVIAQKRN